MTPNVWWLFEVLGLRRPVLPPPSGPQAVDSLRAPWISMGRATEDRRLKRNIQPLYETIASQAKDRVTLSMRVEG